MTPKEKAKELVYKHLPFVAIDNKWDSEYLQKKDNAKQCAIIAVDEILKAIPKEYLEVWQGETNMVINEDVEFWEQVKKEIELL